MRFIQKSCLIVLWILVGIILRAQPRMFTHLDAFDGLSDNKIQHILQLSDGRMVFTTPGTINIYDGARFRYFTSRAQDVLPLPAYKGAYHVYAGGGDLLWVKDDGTLRCFDVRHERYISRLQDLIWNMNGSRKAVTDLFLDSEKTIWLVGADGSVWNTRRKRLYRLPAGNGELQDLDVAGDYGYFFFENGTVMCLSLKSGRVAYVCAAYPATRSRLFCNHQEHPPPGSCSPAVGTKRGNQ